MKNAFNNFDELDMVQQELEETMTSYSTEAIETAIAQSKFTNKQIETILTARGYEGELLETKTKKLSQTTQTNLLADTQKSGADSASGFGFAFQGLADKLNANPKFLGGLTAATAAAGVVYALWKNYKQQMAEAVQASTEAGAAFRESAEGMEAQIAAVQQLRAKLADPGTSEEETLNIKKQLLDIQDSLCDKYGESAKNISLVNGNLETQVGLMRGLTKEEAAAYLNNPENVKGFEESKKQMTKEKNYHLGRVMYRDSESGKIIENLAKEFESEGLELENTGTGFTIQLKADAKDAQKVIGDFQNRLREIQDENGVSEKVSSDIDRMLESAGKSYQKASGIIETHEQNYLDGLYMEMASKDSEKGSVYDIYSQYAEAIDQYNEALKSGEGIESAKKAYEEALKSADSIQEKNPEFSLLFDELDGGLDTRSAGLYRFTEDLSKDRKLSRYAEDLKKLGLDEADVRDFDPEDKKTEDGEKAFEKLKERAAKYGLELDDLIQKLTELGIIQGELGTDTEASAPLSSTDILGNVQSLSEGFGQLQRIYADVADKGTFDWASILNNEGFRTAFGDCGRAYEDFMEAISGSPDDIDACQSAFDNLATAYLNKSGVLREVTDATRDSTTAMLEQMGIANASEIVEQALIANKILAKLETIDFTNASKEEIQALLDEQNSLYGTNYTLLQLLAIKGNLNAMKIDTAGDIEQIIALANAAGVSAVKLAKLQNLKSVMENNGKSSAGGQMDLSEKFAQKTYFALQDGSFWGADTGWTNLNASDYIKPVRYNGSSTPPASSQSGSAASASPSASPSAPSAPAETFDFIDTLITRLEKKLDRYNSKAEDTARSFSNRMRNYRAEIKTISGAAGKLQQSYNAYMSRADGAGLEAEWAAQVRDGNVNIADITDEGLKKRISEYQKWYDKAQSVKEKIDELKEKQKELNRSKLELLLTKYDNYIEKSEGANERIENQISLKESYGESAGITNYKNMNKNIRAQISYTTKQNRELKKLQKTVAEGSEEWRNYQKRIDSNQSALQKLKQSITENAKAAAELAKTKAASKVDQYDAKDDLYKAKAKNAATVYSKNKLADKQFSNIQNRQDAYQNAYNSSRDSLKSSKNSINKLKSKKTNTKNQSENAENKNYNSVLKQVKNTIKSGKKISSSLLNDASKLKDNARLYDLCVQYNAYYDEKASNEEILTLYKETAKQEKRDLAIEQVQNVADSYDAKLADMDTLRSRREASISKMEAAGISQSKRQYQQQIKGSKSKQSQLRAKRNKMQDKLDEMVKKGYIKKSDAQYKEMQNTINSLNVEIAECITEQIAWNKEINNMDLTNLKALESIIESLGNRLSNLASLAESHGHAVSDSLLIDQIKTDQQAVDNASEQLDKYISNLKKYAKTTIDEGGWGLNLTDVQADYLASLAKAQDVDGIKAFCEQLDIEYGQYIELQELVQNIAEEENTILSAKISQEEFYDSLLQKRIDSLNDIISAMDETNEKKDRALSLEKAVFNLEKAKNSLTMKTWNGTEWIYDADHSAVKEAQEALDNAEFEELKNVIQDAIAAIEKLIENNNLYNDDGSISQDLNKVIETVQNLDKNLSDSLIRILSDKYGQLDWENLLQGTAIEVPASSEEPDKTEETPNPDLIPASSFIQETTGKTLADFSKSFASRHGSLLWNPIIDSLNASGSSISNTRQQTINQEFNVTMPNIHDSSSAERLMQEIALIGTAKVQHFNQKK